MILDDIFKIIYIRNTRDINFVMTDYHYIGRKAHIVHGFGLYRKKNNELIGICTYGIPASPALVKGLAGEEYRKNILELTRLFTVDGLEPNSTSWFVSRTLKKLKQIDPDKYFIIAYSDISVGHIGKIYQALSFMYMGLSDKHNRWRIEGLNYHSKALANMGSKQFLEKKFGDRFVIDERPRKHRYLKINIKGKRRKKLLKKVKYKFIKYPIGDTKHAHKDYFKIGNNIKDYF